MKKATQQKTCLKFSFLVGGNTDVRASCGLAWSWVAAGHPRLLRRSQESFWSKHGQRKHFRDKHKHCGSEEEKTPNQTQENCAVLCCKPLKTVVPQGYLLKTCLLMCSSFASLPLLSLWL